MKDLRSVPEAQNPGSDPGSFVTVGAQTFFLADDGTCGRELWCTDGTAAGTRLVKDVVPGPDAGGVAVLGHAGGLLLFGNAEGLWRSDGTTQGTSLLVPGLVWVAGGSGQLANRLVFLATDSATGTEPWVSDGTAAGTSLLADLRPGAGSPSASPFVAVGDQLFVVADDGLNGRELWRTDGTRAGTVLVDDLAPGPIGAFPSVSPQLVRCGTRLFFLANDGARGTQLWCLDDPRSRPRMIVEPSIGATSSFAGATNDAVYVTQGITAGTRELWRSDGSSPGTHKVRDFPAPVLALGGLGALGNVLVFAVAGTGQDRLWRTDGTPAGTFVLTPNVFRASGSATECGGALFFFARDLTEGLFRTDGTVAGTARIHDCLTVTNPARTVHSANGRLFFNGSAPGSSVQEPWLSDGTAAGTRELKDVRQPRTHSLASQLVRTGDRVCFAADDGVRGRDLWSTDGTAAGTALLVDFPQQNAPSMPRSLAVLGARGIGIADETAATRNLYGSDGTAGGTALLQQVSANNPVFAASVLGQVFVNMQNTTSELWRTDGTVAGTQLLGSIGTGTAYRVVGFAAGDTRLFFFGVDPGRNTADLWVYDVPIGQLRLLTRPSMSSIFAPSVLGTIGDRLLFLPVDTTYHTDLWTTDGTDAGTTRLLAWPILVSRNDPGVRVGSDLFFVTSHPAYGSELWKSDGTTSGTGLVLDIRPGTQGTPISALTAAGGRLLFLANDGIHGTELWTSDGTTAGTTMVRDILPGAASACGPVAGAALTLQPIPGTAVVLFSASDGVSGYEPWRSDGTLQGTWRVADCWPGELSSLPHDFVRLRDRILFVARHPDFDEELWSMPLALVQVPIVETFGSGCAGSSGSLPELRAGGTPRVGGAVDIGLQHARPTAAAMLLLGLRADLDLGSGCTLHVPVPAAVLGTRTDAAGAASFTLPIPSEVALRGVSLHAQWLIADPGARALGVAALSAGLLLVVE